MKSPFDSDIIQVKKSDENKMLGQNYKPEPN